MLGKLITVLSEMIVLIFNILIYMQLTVLKKDSRRVRAFLWVVCAAILVIFVGCTASGLMAEAIASFVCVTLPTFTLFFIFSKYKDFRFFVTFCFLDTVTLILTFFSRAVGITFGDIPGAFAAVALCALMLVVYIKGRPYFRRYRELMEDVHDGWGMMALSTLLIYLLLVFAAAYPKPLVERTEYLPVYSLLSVTIIAFYVVFILNLNQKSRLAKFNIELINEKKWFEVAYTDGLTGMKNRTAYMEQANELERSAEKTDEIHVVMIDIDNFKKINDNLGHHAGDVALKNAASLLGKIFCEDSCATFRVGGDEFAVITNGLSTAELERKIAQVHTAEFSGDLNCAFSIGYAKVDLMQNNAMENAMICADSAMYQMKQRVNPRA